MTDGAAAEERLARGIVDVWRVIVSSHESESSALEGTLSVAERSWAALLRSSGARSRFEKSTSRSTPKSESVALRRGRRRAVLAKF